MNIKILNESVVILAQDHNPSILHPYFLSAQGIVPEEWKPAQPPICTPPLSIVTYTNGITFTVEGGKLQVSKSPATLHLRDSEVPECASKYINLLPHVRYTAVGINFAAILPDPDPSGRLISQFLTAGPWNSDELLLSEFAPRFLYSIPGGTLKLSFDPGTVPVDPSTGSITGIIINANYHFSLPDGGPVLETVGNIDKFGDLADQFDRTWRRIFQWSS